MNRRTFGKLAGLAAIVAVAESGELSAQSTDSPVRPAPVLGEQIVLQDSELLAAFDETSGALTRLVHKSTNWSIQRRPELGLSFRMLAPLPHHRSNFIMGEQQKAARVEKISDKEIQIHWKNLQSEHGGVLPIEFSAKVTLEKGSLTFHATVENHSDLTIETIDYPYLGDLRPSSPTELLRSDHMWYGDLHSYDLYPHFRNDKGYWGVDFPTQTIDSKQSLFCFIQGATQGVYVEMEDRTQPYLLQFTFEQHPGMEESPDNLAPMSEQISGIPVHLNFRACHFLFVHPKSRREFAPIYLRTYDGDWHQGMDIYKQRRAAWFQPRQLPAWVQDVHSWLQLQIDGAEQDYSIPYRELPAYIDECAENGVTAIQLVGWNLGGQDGGDPSLSTDPGLGTWEELHQAIQHAKQVGVKMILFGKLYWADLTTDWYKTELYKYAATDPFNIPYQTGGYSYTTPTQLAGINNRRRAIMDVQCQAFRDIATKEFQKTLALDAEGWLFDEVCHHGPVEYSFSSTHGYPPPAYIYGGDMPLARQFREAADKVSRDFIFAGEGPQDWLLQYYPVSYFRIGNASRPVCRYIDSQAPLVIAVTGFDDREMLNLILLNRYIISYEPYNFKGHVTDFPLTLAYGRKIDALRRKYKARLWNSEFRDTLGAEVTADGLHRYSVFVDEGGKRAVIVISQQRDRALAVTVRLPNTGNLVVATPEQPEAQPTSGLIHLPPRSAAVVMES